ncbi:hypothetical protein [Salibacterium halotolerans]|uniref:hypothetical protein n=1 Tax=Salibacterium halotolerans TaxID=1884432 RepID=UPI00147E4F91|nr:hypothetical protein [Salibacterium halotolerans]
MLKNIINGRGRCQTSRVDRLWHGGRNDRRFDTAAFAGPVAVDMMNMLNALHFSWYDFLNTNNKVV